MREFRSDRSLPVFVSLLIVGLLLMTFDIRAQGGGVTGALREGTSQILAPVQRVVSAVVNPVADVMENIGDVARQRAEIESLRARVAEYEAQTAAVQDKLERLQVLERLMNLHLADDQLVKTPADVIGRTDSFDLSFRIDKGEADGLLSGHPVLDENGFLVGKVLETTAHSAVVVPIMADVDSVTVLVGDQVGMLSPVAGSDVMKLEVFDTKTAVQAGQQVVTSQLSVSYPPGIPVGEVVTSTSPVGRTVTATVRPFVDPQRLRVVVVVAWPPEPTSPSETTSTTLGAETTTTGGTSSGGGNG